MVAAAHAYAAMAWRRRARNVPSHGGGRARVPNHGMGVAELMTRPAMAATELPCAWHNGEASSPVVNWQLDDGVIEPTVCRAEPTCV
jgi:hypothetical protein